MNFRQGNASSWTEFRQHGCRCHTDFAFARPFAGASDFRSQYLQRSLLVTGQAKMGGSCIQPRGSRAIQTHSRFQFRNHHLVVFEKLSDGMNVRCSAPIGHMVEPLEQPLASLLAITVCECERGEFHSRRVSHPRGKGLEYQLLMLRPGRCAHPYPGDGALRPTCECRVLLHLQQHRQRCPCRGAHFLQCPQVLVLGRFDFLNSRPYRGVIGN